MGCALFLFHKQRQWFPVPWSQALTYFKNVSCYHVGSLWSMLSHFSHVQLSVTPWTAAHQAPLSMGFSRQEYWSVLPHHSDPGIEPASPALQVDSLPTKLPGTRDTAWLLTLFLLFPFQRENRRLSVNALTEAHLPHVSRNTNRRLVLNIQPEAHFFLPHEMQTRGQL